MIFKNVIREVDSTKNSCRTNKGQIISIQEIDNHYKCQGCGGSNITDAGTVISCNDCHTRLFKDSQVNDECLNIKISLINNEELIFKICKSTIIRVLTKITESDINQNDLINLHNKLKHIISSFVEFNYDETNGINNIEILSDNITHDQSIFELYITF
jgi:DNA-directed RNA polymerase subunit RPC12/RpoP